MSVSNDNLPYQARQDGCEAYNPQEIGGPMSFCHAVRL
jgi:hypothetical protein